MSSLRIETEGFSVSEVLKLAAEIQEIDGVESAKFAPSLPGEPQFRAFPALPASVLHILVRLGSKAVEGAFTAAGGTAGKIGVEKVWALVSRKTDASPGAGARLYDAYGRLIEEKGRH